jgi:membrane-associated phospholipid phosphatase
MAAVEAPPNEALPSLGCRLRAHPVIKGVGLTAGMTAFFAAYFLVQDNPVYPVTVIPALALDHAIPFSPYWILPYFSLWIYVSLYPALLTERRALGRYALVAIGLSVVGLAIFHRWPTAIVQAEGNWEHHRLVAFLKTVDAAGNVCPSLHVAFALFTAEALDRFLRDIGARARWRTLNASWAAAIVYSTLATEQHVVLDVLAGLALGALASVVHAVVRGRNGRASQDRRCPPAPT